MAINRHFASAMAGIVALGAVALPMAANAADGKVRYKDIRHDTPGYVELAGPTASGRNRIALKVNGGDKAFFMSTLAAANIISKKTDRDVWVLLSKDDDPNDGKIKIEIYVSGGKTGTLTVFDTELLNKKLIAVVNDGINRSTASLEQPAEAATAPPATLTADKS